MITILHADDNSEDMHARERLAVSSHSQVSLHSNATMPQAVAHSNATAMPQQWQPDIQGKLDV